jgi:hypothetical protein
MARDDSKTPITYLDEDATIQREPLTEFGISLRDAIKTNNTHIIVKIYYKLRHTLQPRTKLLYWLAMKTNESQITRVHKDESGRPICS